MFDQIKGINDSFYFINKNNNFTYNDLISLRHEFKAKHQTLLKFVWWDLWLNKKDIVQSKINHYKGLSKKIHARKTIVKPVDKKIAFQFQIDNHLNSPLLGFRRFGLYNGTNLIAIAVFAKKRKFKDGSYSAELLHYCTLNHHHINGGLSKLIASFVKTYPIDSLMTYVDLDWSDGEKFKKVGFEIIEKQPPRYFKVINQLRVPCDIEESDVFNMGNLKLMLNLNTIK
jgi:hypothetical protein